MISLLALLSVFSPLASSSKTPVATCCPPGSFLAIEDSQESRQLPNGLWVESKEKKQHLASPTWDDDGDFGRHIHISKVFCVPDKNNLPAIDGFAGSSYPDPPYFATVNDKFHTRETGNGTKPLANTQILQSTGLCLTKSLLGNWSYLLRFTLGPNKVGGIRPAQGCLPR